MKDQDARFYAIKERMNELRPRLNQATDAELVEYMDLAREKAELFERNLYEAWNEGISAK